MDGVTPEIAETVAVLFEDDDVDSRSGEQQGEHHPGRSAPCDAAACGDRLAGRRDLGCVVLHPTDVGARPATGKWGAPPPRAGTPGGSIVARSLERVRHDRRAA